ncbi:MAG: DUF4350 domain-containing protein [Chloroflexi bacterium]|nr:DUF4350 domain-containing protein [Chloroflexota bacterium]
MRSPWLLLALGLLLAGLVGSTLLARQNQRFVPLTTYSPQPDGARALALWLEAMGEPVLRLEASPYALDPSVQVLFVLEPSSFFEPAHGEALEAWVRQGGMLVLAGNHLPARPLLQRFGLEPRPVAPRVERAGPAQPLFPALPVREVVLRAPDVLEVRGRAVVPLLAEGEQLLGASVEVGQGRVVVLASPYPLTNAGLSQADNPALALDLLALAPPGATIAFDEYHHGFIRREQQSALALALRSPWGWAVGYAGLATLAYLALSGRHFGRPVPLVRERRRGVGEYVRAMAHLYRRAGQRRFIARHYAQQARRRLARGLGLDPTLPLPALAEWLRTRGRPSTALLATLERLESPAALGERDLLRLVQATDAHLARLLGSGVLEEP